MKTSLMQELAELGIVGKQEGGPGGVGIYGADFPISEYETLKQKLTEKFGAPVIKECWHDNHTKKCPPLRFCFPMREHVDHVHLISMMQQKKKQYCTVAWMEPY